MESTHLVISVGIEGRNMNEFLYPGLFANTSNAGSTFHMDLNKTNTN